MLLLNKQLSKKIQLEIDGGYEVQRKVSCCFVNQCVFLLHSIFDIGLQNFNSQLVEMRATSQGLDFKSPKEKDSGTAVVFLLVL